MLYLRSKRNIVLLLKRLSAPFVVPRSVFLFLHPLRTNLVVFSLIWLCCAVNMLHPYHLHPPTFSKRCDNSAFPSSAVSLSFNSTFPLRFECFTVFYAPFVSAPRRSPALRSEREVKKFPRVAEKMSINHVKLRILPLAFFSFLSC